MAGKATAQSSFANRSSGAIAQPVPSFTLPELPEKLRRIDPAGSKQWHQQANQSVADWIRSQNAVSTDISTAIKR